MKTPQDFQYEELDELLEGEFRHNAINKLILRYIFGKKIIDVGCGSGILLKFLLKSNYKAIGCDSSHYQCELARNRLRQSNLNPKAIYNIPLQKTSKWKNIFDTVICIDVLEHIKNDSEAARSLIKLVKPGGRLILLVPALPAMWSRRDVKVGHYRRYTKATLRNLFSRLPAKIIQIRYWSFIGLIIAWIIFKLGLDLKADRCAACNKPPLNIVNQFIELWLIYIENIVPIPLGLSLFMVIDRKK